MRDAWRPLQLFRHLLFNINLYRALKKLKRRRRCLCFIDNAADCKPLNRSREGPSINGPFQSVLWDNTAPYGLNTLRVNASPMSIVENGSVSLAAMY